MSVRPEQRPLLRHQMLLEESDRGCVLIAVAAIDESMELLLRSKFSKEEKTLKKSVDPLFGPSGALSSFGTKTNLCNALGLLSPDYYSDLEKMRRLRNRFAHIHEPVSLQDKDIASVVATLSTTEFFRREIKVVSPPSGPNGKLSDKAISELGYVSFPRSCFVWCAERIDLFLRSAQRMDGSGER